MSWRRYLPTPIRDRIEVNTYLMKRLLAEAATGVPPGALVLDAGAGEGRFSKLFDHTRYVGVDLAVGDASWDYAGLSALNALEQLCFANDTFDVAVCTQVLEHVREPQQVLCEIQRVLKPGGYLLLVAPQSWHEHQIPHDFYRYTSYGLRHLLAEAGLEVEQMTPLGGYFWYLSFQLQLFTYWTFSRNEWGRMLGRWSIPVKFAAIALFELALPLLLFYLDRTDRVREATLGHFCVARKPLRPLDG
jgi:SAM-dependent methyltransferase